MQLRAFLAALAPVAARQPQVFVDACRAALDIQGWYYFLWLAVCSPCFAPDCGGLLRRAGHPR